MNKLLNIEFLRGFAVTLVFIFHYNQILFSSFFVGVDIFFLLSGYVITKSIYSKNKFDFFNFLLRRVKRIYPALIFTLFLFFIFYFLFYKNYIDDYENNLFSIIFTILGISNFYYSANANLFYFNQEIRWLIHTWSLSVEIQFYILVALISSFFYSKRFNIKIYTKYFFFIISIISFLLFILTDIKYISDYYSLPGRLWEFSLGSWLYFLKKKKN
jgi:peptidoglycan/LPS O-acetylase OafA/YrhL